MTKGQLISGSFTHVNIATGDHGATAFLVDGKDFMGDGEQRGTQLRLEDCVFMKRGVAVSVFNQAHIKGLVGSITQYEAFWRCWMVWQSLTVHIGFRIVLYVY